MLRACPQDCTRKLTAVLSLVVVVSIGYTRGIPESPDLLSVIQNNRRPYQAVCIADGNAKNSSVEWIFAIPDLEEKLPIIDSKYVPAIENDYTCNFALGTKCLKSWKMDGWSFSQFLDGYYPVIDERADDFRVVLTSRETKEFQERFPVSHTFNLGLSLRSVQNGEALLCEGWNPYVYPCYHFNFGGVDGKTLTFKKFKSLPNGTLEDANNLAKYKGEILTSEDEWRSYNVSLNEDGVIKVADLLQGEKLLSYKDPQPLEPIYLLLRSTEPVLWKVHNVKFISTSVPGTTKLGPTLFLNSSDLCISLYVLMCKNCTFTFSIHNEEREETLEIIDNENDEEIWKEIKLTKEDLLSPKTDIYVKTDTIGKVKKPFWSISNVRVCNSEEIRMRSVLYNLTKMENGIAVHVKDDLACQSLQHPTWRPKLHYSVPSNVDLKTVSTEPTAIRLQWEYSQSSWNLDYHPYFLIHYEGRDRCEYASSTLRNSLRKMSRAFLITKEEEMTIENLIPYTVYDISITEIVSGRTIKENITTMETRIPTKGELPVNVTISPDDTWIRIKWSRPKCFDVHGPLVYKLNIKNATSDSLQTSTIDQDDLKLDFRIRNLKPFSPYTLEILTARSVEQLNLKSAVVNSYNFTTLPGSAAAVTDLEVYEIDKFYASLRYNLPEKSFGVPQDVKVVHCHPLYLETCSTTINNLTRCALWTNMYCIRITKLLPNHNYTFSVSLKNANTTKFGLSVNTHGLTVPQRPGEPTNITYKVVDCSREICNIMVNWSHPYHPRGAITAFHLSLTDINLLEESDETRSIYEILKVPDGAYQRQYSVLVKYVQHSTDYLLTIIASNDKYRKGAPKTIQVKMPNFHEFIDYAPTLANRTDTSLTFTIPPWDQRVKTMVLPVVQDIHAASTEAEDVLDTFSCEIEKCSDHGTTWIAELNGMYHNNDNSSIITIKDLIPILDYNKSTQNVAKLTPNTSYCITFVFINKYQNEESCLVYHRNATTDAGAVVVIAPSKSEKQPKFASVSITLSIVFLLVAAGVGGILLYRRYQRRRLLKNRRNGETFDENVYEQMPFEDYLLEDSAFNPTYDRLIHT